MPRANVLIPTAPLIAVLLGIAGCTNTPQPTSAPSSSAPSVTATGLSSPAADVAARELQFVRCMRAQDVEIIDPVPGDTSGRSALLHEIDVNGKGSDPKFQEALDACTTYLPPSTPIQADQESIAKLREFSVCMRKNGLPDFPDPDPSGENVTYFPPAKPGASSPQAVGAITRFGKMLIVQTPETEAAMRACQHVMSSPSPKA